MGGGQCLGRGVWSLVVWLVLSLAACQLSAPPVPIAAGAPLEDSQASPTLLSPTPSPTPTQAPQQASSLKATSTLPIVPTASPTSAAVFYEPAGCWQPPDTYEHVSINSFTLNARTYAMLQQAARLYGGEVDIAGSAIIQGSYSNSNMDNLGTHLGGGAVDLAVTDGYSDNVLYKEIEPVIQALRTVGFAAWLREDDKAEAGLGIHIHAIAIGDRELSAAAQEQLTGPAGYLRGMDGLPVANGEPGQDRYAGPVICRWMVEAGYANLQPTPPGSTPGVPWQERLRQAAMAYQAFYPEDAEQVARNLNFLDGNVESAENICGPLSAAILRDAGLLPNQIGPVQDLKSYWQARPSTNGRPWSLFPERDYEVFRFDTPLQEFDFSAWPLQPADFLYTYAKNGGYEHMFIVTEVDAQGRAYTVTNQPQPWGNDIWGTMLILRYMLYDPQSPGEGIIYHQWSDPHIGQTGFGGFEVLRRRGLAAGSMYAYTVRPGDTLPVLSARYGATPESIIQANPLIDLANLQVGQKLTIPIPSYSPEPTEQVQGGLP